MPGAADRVEFMGLMGGLSFKRRQRAGRFTPTKRTTIRSANALGRAKIQAKT